MSEVASAAPLPTARAALSIGDVRRLRFATGLWIGLAVALCVKAAIDSGEHSVYPIYAWGSRHWWADQPLHALYAELNIDIYRYSPTFAVLFTPFALLPDWLGASLWGILLVGATFFGMRLMARELLPGQWSARREAWFLELTLFGSLAGIWSEQSNSLILALAIFAAVAIKYERWWMASVLLGLPVFIKIWPLAAVLLMMACWPKQLTWRFAIVFAAFAALPFLTKPHNTVIDQHREWYVSLNQQALGRWPSFRDAWTIWENLRPPVPRRAYQALQVLSSFPVLLWCLWQRQRLKRGAKALFAGHLLTLVISIWACWQLLFGPGTELLTYGLIAPSAAWAVLVSFSEQRHRLWTTVNWMIPAFLSCGDIEAALIGLRPGFAMLLPLGVASYAAWLIYHERGGVRPS
jgi:hypothetical protein